VATLRTHPALEQCGTHADTVSLNSMLSGFLGMLSGFPSPFFKENRSESAAYNLSVAAHNSFWDSRHVGYTFFNQTNH
jgi:hypothetical protein